MLKVLRKNTKLIIWIVVLSFALWGAYSVGTQFQKEGRVAGSVFGKEITFQEFNRFYKSSQIFSFNEQKNNDPAVLRQQTWQNIIYSREAKRRKIKVTDDEVRQEILRLLSAQKIENPTPDFYHQWVQNSLRETPQEFESQIRELLRIQKLVRQVQEQAPAAPPVDEKKSEEEKKQAQEAAEKSRLDHFIGWHTEVFSRAQLKDYLPPEPEPSPVIPAEAGIQHSNQTATEK